VRGTTSGSRCGGGRYEDGAGYDCGEVVVAGGESAAVPSGIMRREQWQLLPIHVGGVGGGCSGVGYYSPPRVSHQKSAGG